MAARDAELRRGSAPTIYEKQTIGGGHHDSISYVPAGASTTQRRTRPTNGVSNAAAYVFTSDSGNDDSDSDSDEMDSADLNQRADFYQPASHLRKAVNTKLNSNTGKATGSKISKSGAA